MLTQQTHNSPRSAGAVFSTVSIPEYSPATGRIYNSKPESVGDVTTRFGCRLRQLRRDRNLTQMQMAHRFGIDRSYISEVERGRKSVSLVTLELIALGFRMSLSDVMNSI
jgi:DNA-binding XRE family transcriptional regulator